MEQRGRNIFFLGRILDHIVTGYNNVSLVLYAHVPALLQDF